MRSSAALLVLGVVFEFAGIVLLGFPDFVPGAIRLSGWLRRRSRAVENRLRRLLRLPPRPFVHKAGVDAAVGVELSASAVQRTGATTLEDKVEYLLRRDLDAQRQANELTGRVARLETESSRRLAELRRQMEDHVARELTAALEVYRPLRVVGTLALALGLVCVSAATFLA
jgi:hypothetical protein